ncbi:CCA tRNA nucleotidyltransferase [Gymnodinialimonas ceratoperidinii]|uniref:CCA tRNA nucleotidyltransferase n=1 Tax=Gymnodinialimonas ceratoperidinii TaxID=2856823 RepID=A0A8F6TXG9_9RHOB|nr:CCA tRNA nucleotidyltransferase [Gymnodinialimonas ceratoperidinii]QXT39949.1 CCA tRNA nucleotidyltransferase [Gymnodinialimonas ceratoperidinii]
MTRLQADWLHAPGSKAVFDALGGHGAWFVGGCVRNGLLGLPVADIDICTELLPQEVMDLAKAAGLKAIPTGIDHGTVTLVADGTPYEITTLRRDIETDGRHASVAFTRELAEDAARRDFTMNALYATRGGEVLDPNGRGLSDLRDRRLRFIGDAAERIAEDHLRILRFFRFHAWYADPAGGIDAEGLAACAAGIDGIARLSRERIGAEMKTLLRAPDPAPSVAAMDQSGVLAAVLPGASSPMLTLLTGLEGEMPPDAIRRLAAMGGEDAPDRLRLSKAEAKRLALYRAEMTSPSVPGALGYRHGAEPARDILVLRGLLSERPPTGEALDAAEQGAQARFPVKAADLPDLQGPALGQHLKKLETRWIDSDFTLTKSDLLN